MTKITALLSGCDWADAVVEHLVLPDSMDLKTEKEGWNTWYTQVYCPAIKTIGLKWNARGS